MAQYKIGSASVTNGSATVTGVDTLWSAEVSSGDIFTIVGDNAWYEVGSVGSNTSITLTSVYAGASAIGAQYAISRDFTTNKSIPYPQKGDIETASLLKRAMNIIDNELSNGFDSSNVTITGGTINGTSVGATTASTGRFTTLTTSGTVTLNGGTANGVTYLNGSKVLTSGSALTFDGTNFGVGVASPAAKLDVSANAAIMGYFRSSGGSANDIRFTITSGGDRVVLDAAQNSTGTARDLAFTTGGTERVRLTIAGNLGIGTTSPTNALSVSGNANITGNTTLGDATSDTITANGRFNTDVVPSTDNARDLGTTALKWRQVYATAFTENGFGVVSQTDIGTAPNEIPLNQYLGDLAYMNAEAVVIQPQASVTPNGIGDMVFQLTSDTSLVIKVKGSDGTVRSVALTLA
jgi:hypothetical protein